MQRSSAGGGAGQRELRLLLCIRTWFMAWIKFMFLSGSACEQKKWQKATYQVPNHLRMRQHATVASTKQAKVRLGKLTACLALHKTSLSFSLRVCPRTRMGSFLLHRANIPNLWLFFWLPLTTYLSSMSFPEMRIRGRTWGHWQVNSLLLLVIASKQC